MPFGRMSGSACLMTVVSTGPGDMKRMGVGRIGVRAQLVNEVLFSHCDCSRSEVVDRPNIFDGARSWG
jgi:hypothetical protein